MKEISAREAAEQLGVSYFQFLNYCRRDKAGVMTKGLVRKVGWGWIVLEGAVEALRNEKTN